MPAAGVGLKFQAPRYDPLAVALRQVARGGARQTLAAAIAGGVRDLIDDRFDARATPSGVPWAPRKPPTGTWPLLEKTGAMRRGFQVRAQTTGVTVTNTQEYAQFHQTGTRYMPARPILPRGPLPSWWRSYLDLVVAETLKKIVEGR